MTEPLGEISNVERIHSGESCTFAHCLCTKMPMMFVDNEILSNFDDALSGNCRITGVDVELWAESPASRTGFVKLKSI